MVVILCLAVVTVLTLQVQALPTTTPTVDVGYATYAGNLTYPNVVSYLGIPYAEPPVGESRFRSPVPLNTTRIQEAANGKPFDATSYPDFCIQSTTGAGDAGGAGSEDCLKVNIYSPLGAKKADKLPVLVYFHGGAYTYGNPGQWPFDHWVQQVPHVVIVSVYYRLGVYGFLAHPEFLSNSTLGDLNAGFQDQTEALRWVQKHISAFGGDPGRVTIDGDSAGGTVVALRMVVPHMEGLFHAGIAQSAWRPPTPTPAQQEPLFNFLSQQAGCSSGTLTEQMRCLRDADTSILSRAQDTPFNGSYNAFHVVQEPNTVPDLLTTSLLQNRFRRLPLMVGSTSNETVHGLADSPSVAISLKSFYPQLSDEDLREYEQQYPITAFDNSTQQIQTATYESWFVCTRSIMGGAFSGQNVNTWSYRYNQPNPANGDAPLVDHQAENYIMFRGTNPGFNGTTTYTPLDPVQTAFSEELIAYWLSFVRTGDPNTYKLDRSPRWPGYETNGKNRIVLQQGTDVAHSGSHVEQESSVESRRCAFVRSKSAAEQT
ncbi:alpha/beta-hydrolase [Abortiporus biennis]|nr:alpha/beta-hydrolase [Abortiporus biennis]